MLKRTVLAVAALLIAGCASLPHITIGLPPTIEFGGKPTPTPAPASFDATESVTTSRLVAPPQIAPQGQMGATTADGSGGGLQYEHTIFPKHQNTCCGDCNGDWHITIDELNYAHDHIGPNPGWCPAADCDGDGSISTCEFRQINALFNYAPDCMPRAAR